MFEKSPEKNVITCQLRVIFALVFMTWAKDDIVLCLFSQYAIEWQMIDWWWWPWCCVDYLQFVNYIMTISRRKMWFSAGKIFPSQWTMKTQWAIGQTEGKWIIAHWFVDSSSQLRFIHGESSSCTSSDSAYLCINHFTQRNVMGITNWFNHHQVSLACGTSQHFFFGGGLLINNVYKKSFSYL